MNGTKAKSALRKYGLTKRNGTLKINDELFFFKKLSLEHAKREVEGWIILKNEYPIVSMVDVIKIDNQAFVLYEYDKGAAKNELLLYQFIHEYQEDRIENILQMFSRVFVKTLGDECDNSSSIFFKERIEPRLLSWYAGADFNKELAGGFYLNNKYVNGNLEFTKLLTYSSKASELKHVPSVVSQCDAHDLNITIRPLVLDYTAGGYVPLMAEYATFIWGQTVFAQFLAPTLNPDSYANHPDIYRHLDIFRYDRSTKSLTHFINKNRVVFIEDYSIRVIERTLAKGPKYDEWYDHFLGFITMKLLCAYDLRDGYCNETRVLARTLVIVYLHFFYCISPKSPSELASTIKDLYK